MINLVVSDWLFLIRKPLLFLSFLLSFSVVNFAQSDLQDSTQSIQVVDNQQVIKTDSTENKTIKTKKSKFIPIPKRAALLSLAPGVGQIYNRKYAAIKVPIIYGGLIGLGFWANFEERLFVRLKTAHKLEVAGKAHEFDNNPNLDSATELLQTRDAVDKTRQQAYVTIGIVYMFQIIEAYVAAHLIDFDIDDDLSFKLKPSFENSPVGNVTGIGVGVSF